MYCSQVDFKYVKKIFYPSAVKSEKVKNCNFILKLIIFLTK